MQINVAEGETQMNFRIPEEKKVAFLKKAKANGTSGSKVLLEFIDSYLGISLNSSDEIDSIKKRIALLEEFKERTEKILREFIA